MGDWSIARELETCGFCSRRLQEDEPVYLMGPAHWERARKMKRCATHAQVPVDWDVVDAERHAVETQRAAAADRAAAERAELEARGLTAPPAAPVPAVRRIRPVRKPLGFTQVAAAGVFDPKKAAANDE